MKCIFSQEKINEEVESNLKYAINKLNKSDCPWMHPFDQSYVSSSNLPLSILHSVENLFQWLLRRI